MFEKNVGGFDRIVRAILAIALTIGVLAAVSEDRARTRPIAVALVCVAALSFNVLTQRCGANKLLGIDTCSRD